MVFVVIYFVVAFELAIYSCMVANREWLFSAYRRVAAGEPVRYGRQSGDGGAADYDDYEGFAVDDY